MPSCWYMSRKPNLTNKKPTSTDRSTRTSRRSSVAPVVGVPNTPFLPSVPALVEDTEDLTTALDPDIDIVAIKSVETQTPSTVVASLPESRCPSPISSSDDMPTNTNGKETIDMGSMKTGCMLLVSTPTLETLEELWD